MNKTPFHHILLAVYAILVLVAAYAQEITFADATGWVALSAVASIVAYRLFRLAKQPPEKAALLSSLGVLWFYSYSHVLGSLLLQYGGGAIAAPVYCAVFAVAGIWVVRSRRSFAPLTGALNVMGASAVVIAASQTILSLHQSPASYGAVETRSNIIDTKSVPRSTGPHPDIYYILVDMYAGEECLQDIMGFNDEPFLSALRKRGFWVNPRSHSNYPFTLVSMAATLNMQYNDRLAEMFGQHNRSLLPFYDRIKADRVTQIFRNQGYAITVMNAPTNETTILSAIKATSVLQAVSDNIDRDRSRKQTLATLRYLNAHARSTEGPQFVYAHIYCPHPPFVFDAQGRRVVSTHASDASLYIEQVKFVNTQLLRTVDDILARSKTPPIIIIQGDHGAHVKFPEMPETNGTIEERFSILNAYYLPGGGDRDLYPGITPVNSFRVVLNHYFGAHFPILPDREYYTTYERPYDYDDCTDRIEAISQAADARWHFTNMFSFQSAEARRIEPSYAQGRQ